MCWGKDRCWSSILDQCRCQWIASIPRLARVTCYGFGTIIYFIWNRENIPFPPSPLALHHELVNCTVTLICGKQQVAYCMNVTTHSHERVGAKVSSIPEEQIYTTIYPAILWNGYLLYILISKKICFSCLYIQTETRSYYAYWCSVSTTVAY